MTTGRLEHCRAKTPTAKTLNNKTPSD